MENLLKVLHVLWDIEVSLEDRLDCISRIINI